MVLPAPYAQPSKIQETALPLLLRHPFENLIFQSQPGTGKTAAFTLNILSRCDPTLKYPQVSKKKNPQKADRANHRPMAAAQAIITAPTFVLVEQIKRVIDAMAKYTGLTTYLGYVGIRACANGMLSLAAL